MEPIADVAELEPIVQALVGRGLMLEVTPPGRGQIVSHNLYLPGELDELSRGTPDAGAPASAARTSGTQRPAGPPPTQDATGELAALRAEIAGLRRRVEELEKRLGDSGA
jgi:hypothetical protein